MNKEEFNHLLRHAIKPYKCICGKTYKTDMGVIGGFVSNNITNFWCCSYKCSKDTMNKLY